MSEDRPHDRLFPEATVEFDLKERYYADRPFPNGAASCTLSDCTYRAASCISDGAK
jgi:hypothetical protein